MKEIEVPIMDRTWVDIPTPQGPDIQVRYSSQGSYDVAIEWRIKPHDCGFYDNNCGCTR